MDNGLAMQLLVAIEETTIFTIPPHLERWQDGFNSLDEARRKISGIRVGFERKRDTPLWLIADLSTLMGKLNDMVRLRDDFYRNFPDGMDNQPWGARLAAEHALADLQRDVAAMRNNIRLKLEDNDAPNGGDGGDGGDGRRPPSIEVLLAFSFGVVFTIAMLVIAFLFPTPTRSQYNIFKVVLSLAAAGVAAMIPGFIGLHSRIIRAGGALAVFVLVLYNSPADIVSTPPPKPLQGSVILRDGFKDYDTSGYSFASSQLVAWNSQSADILAARQTGAITAGFFLPYDVKPYANPSLDSHATSGIQRVRADRFDDIQTCPSTGYTYHWFQPELNAYYCVRTRSGSHFAVIRVASLDDDRIGIEYRYQASGGINF